MFLKIGAMRYREESRVMRLGAIENNWLIRSGFLMDLWVEQVKKGVLGENKNNKS